MEDELSSRIEELRSVLSRSKRIAFLGGAGTSTESGIPDFRSEKGVFEAVRRFGHKPEVLLSHDFFLSHPDVFFEYYRDFLLYPNAKPNDAHRALASLERAGKLGAVITQNIDGLHQKAGSKNVLELHGNVNRNYCMNCKKSFSMRDILAKSGVPKCDCGGMIKPDVVLYGEGLDEKVLRAAITQVSRADTLIIGGTSLAVYPAAGLMDYFSGRNLVVLNLTQTARDTHAALSIRAPIGQVLRRAVLENPQYS